MGLIDIGQEIDALQAEKSRLIRDIKKVSDEMRKVGPEIAKRVVVLKRLGRSSSRNIRAQMEEIEFVIATTAFTAKKEKELIKELKALGEQLAQAKESDKLQTEVDQLRAKFSALKADYSRIDAEIAAAKAKIDERFTEAKRQIADSAARKQGAQQASAKRAVFAEQKRRKDTNRKQFDSEMAPYLKKEDEFLTLEDKIIEIKKKDKGEEKKAEEKTEEAAAEEKAA